MCSKWNKWNEANEAVLKNTDNKRIQGNDKITTALSETNTANAKKKQAKYLQDDSENRRNTKTS